MLFEDDNRRGVQAQHAVKIGQILMYLNVAKSPEDMNIPGFDLHPLAGKYATYWSVSVSKNWRIVFRFEDENVHDVNLVDYH